MAEDLDWDRFDTVGVVVMLKVGHIWELQADVQSTLTIYLRVLGPHCSEHQANGADGVVHCAVANICTAGTDFATAVLAGKVGEDWDGFPLQQE